MRVSMTAVATFCSCLSTIAASNNITLQALPDVIAVGSGVDIEWVSSVESVSSDHPVLVSAIARSLCKQAFQLSLVKATDYGWRVAEHISQTASLSAGSHAYNWVVPDVDTKERYAIFIEGGEGEVAGASPQWVDSQRSPWFDISLGKKTGLTGADLAGIVVAAVVGFAGFFVGAYILIQRLHAEMKRSPTLTMPPPPPPPPADWRQSMDSIEVEKERARLAAKGIEVSR